jgi:hypothetical protein
MTHAEPCAGTGGRTPELFEFPPLGKPSFGRWRATPSGAKPGRDLAIWGPCLESHARELLTVPLARSLSVSSGYSFYGAERQSAQC